MAEKSVCFVISKSEFFHSKFERSTFNFLKPKIIVVRFRDHYIASFKIDQPIFPDYKFSLYIIQNFKSSWSAFIQIVLIYNVTFIAPCMKPWFTSVLLVFDNDTPPIHSMN